MQMKEVKQIIAGSILLVIFILYTISLGVIDIAPIGPNESYVGYSTLNWVLHRLLGVNMILYHITDWVSLVPFFVVICFVTLGLIQWIKRGNIAKVDANILLLGAYYLLIFTVYIFFEFVVINRRPVLISGVLEASYPSSTTMLAMCVMPSVITQAKILFKRRATIRIVATISVLFEAFMVLGRLFSGVHWFTDILGGAIFSTSIFLIYNGVNNFLILKE